MTSRPSMPFRLSRAAGEAWSGRWAEEKLRVAVAGTDDAPDPALEATLGDVVARWPDIRRAIATFASALPPDEHIILEPAGRGSFAARSCGFDEELCYESITATDAAAPRRARVTFYTGFPDGYATFAVMLEDGEPVAITAFAS